MLVGWLAESTCGVLIDWPGNPYTALKGLKQPQHHKLWLELGSAVLRKSVTLNPLMGAIDAVVKVLLGDGIQDPVPGPGDLRMNGCHPGWIRFWARRAAALAARSAAKDQALLRERGEGHWSVPATSTHSEPPLRTVQTRGRRPEHNHSVAMRTKPRPRAP